MPSVEPTDFGPAAVTATSIVHGRCPGGATRSAAAAEASAMPQPPYTERAADADEARASALTWSSGSSRPAARLAASASAAKPEALEASPAAVGKSLTLDTRA